MQYRIPENRFRNFYFFDEVTSTMDVCEDLIRSGVCSGIAVAGAQTAGRGRNAKKWLSENNGNIYLSFFGKMENGGPGFIPQRCAVASLKTAAAFAGSEDVRIKWPNDILVGMKKVSGVIAKSILFNDERFYICGIGVNVFLPDSGKMKFVWEPASLSECDPSASTEKVLCELVRQIDSAFGITEQKVLDIYGKNIGWMRNAEITFSQDLVKNEKGRIFGFSEDFSVMEILADDGMKELSAVSILNIVC